MTVYSSAQRRDLLPPRGMVAAGPVHEQDGGAAPVDFVVDPGVAGVSDWHRRQVTGLGGGQLGARFLG